MNDKIDFVVTWVDESDINWQEDRKKYYNKSENDNLDNDEIRYRDMDCLRYWFRGIEKFAPWVNKIYFVTYGHLPKWLNTKNEKIVIVNHKDYIEEKHLPTFNSSAIELELHKIKGLEEKFVYFNDDSFLINKVEKRDFFKNNLPCDTMVLQPIQIKYYDDFYKTICNNIAIINKNFSFKDIIKNNKSKILSLKQRKYLLKTIPALTFGELYGFHIFHLPISYLKSTYNKVWQKEKDILEKNYEFKFRNNRDSVTGWLFEYWQFATGNYNQRKSNFGKYVSISNEKVYDMIKNQKYKVLCINDDDRNCNFEEIKVKLKEAFEKILPEKSSFEN